MIQRLIQTTAKGLAQRDKKLSKEAQAEDVRRKGECQARDAVKRVNCRYHESGVSEALTSAPGMNPFHGVRPKNPS